jgi:hypothetical protein
LITSFYTTVSQESSRKVVVKRSKDNKQQQSTNETHFFKQEEEGKSDAIFSNDNFFLFKLNTIVYAKESTMIFSYPIKMREQDAAWTLMKCKIKKSRAFILFKRSNVQNILEQIGAPAVNQ